MRRRFRCSASFGARILIREDQNCRHDSGGPLQCFGPSRMGILRDTKRCRRSVSRWPHHRCRQKPRGAAGRGRHRGAHGLHVSDRPRSPMVTGRTAALSQSCRTCRNPSSPMGNFRAAAPSGRPVTPSPHHPSTCPAPSPRRHPAPPARIPQPTPPCFACSGPRSHRRRWRSQSRQAGPTGFGCDARCFPTPPRQLKPPPTSPRRWPARPGCR